MKKIILISIFIFTFLETYSQPQWIIYNTSNSGLPDSYVGSILIDSNNVKWITTGNGFVRLKGNSWYVYDTLNSGLPQNSCGGVTKDKFNKIWLGTSSKGLAKFDGINWTIFNTQNTGVPINYSNSIDFDNSNTKWIGGFAGLFKYNDTNWVWYKPENSGIPSNSVSSVLVQGNIIWVGTLDAGIARFDGQNWITYNYYNSGLPSNWIYMIKSDIYNNIWMATFFGGVAKFNYGQNNWTVYNTGNSGLHDNNTYSIYIDNDNVKWIGAGGCAIFNDITWQIIPYEFINDVHNFSKDKYGNMWICASGGLYVYNPNGVIGIENNTSIIPENFLFIKNYPNPFNTQTNIKISIPEKSEIQLSIYDITGRYIEQIAKGKLNKGNHEFLFNGENCASGIYLVVLKTESKIKTHKIVLQK